MTALRITLDQARHAWVAQQRLGGERDRGTTLVDAVTETGWIPMPSAVTPYLALFARGLIERRSELDARLAEFAIVPGPKGSTWLVPAADAPLARAFAVADHATRDARIAATTTLPTRELASTRELLRAELSRPLGLEALRTKVPDSALRSLGAPGRKAGMPTLAAMVLRAMWVEGEVHRVMSAGRLDAGEVTWAIDPRPRVVPPAADAVAQVASRWIAAHGPVTARTFANAFGTPAGRAMPSIRAAKPMELSVEGFDEVFLARPGFAPLPPQSWPVRFLPARDPLTEVHLAMLAPTDAVRAATTRAGTSAACVIVNGRVVATWVFDPASREAIATPIDQPIDASVMEAVRAESRRVGEFLANEIDAALLRPGTVATARSRGAAVANDLVIEM